MGDSVARLENSVIRKGLHYFLSSFFVTFFLKKKRSINYHFCQSFYITEINNNYNNLGWVNYININIDDYVLTFENYKEGNYEYGTIASGNDIKNAIRNGKKFVFTVPGITMAIKLGICFISIGLILTLILYYLIHEHFLTLPLLTIGIGLIPFLIFALFGLIFLILGLWNLKKFMVLGAEGIVYKKRGAIKSCKWKEVSMEIVEETSELSLSNDKVIYISTPNGDFLKSYDYTTKEFPKTIRGREIDTMSFHTFLNYYNYGKRGTFEPSNF
jgi:hypothetical protein